MHLRKFISELSKVLSRLRFSTGLFHSTPPFIFTLLLLSQFPVLGQNDLVNKVVPIGSEYQNSIALLNNRFRIDSDVQEVILLFFRVYGTEPIVLVRPDGSKLHLDNDLNDDSYAWFETDKFDMISLKKPMPGPWQAIGNILPNSKVMIIAGVTLQAEAIPTLVFSGETIKQTAQIENKGSKIDFATFRDVVSLSIDFISTNNPEFSNFGLGTRSVAHFRDDGLEFDEYGGDGIFTGQFDLKITEGEWRPVFTVRTPLFSREQVNDNVVLLPSPIVLSHTEATELNKDHVLSINVMPEYVLIDTLVVDGNVRHPSGEIESFSLTQTSNNAKQYPIVNNEYGIYKVNMKAFAKSTSGRDLVLEVPEYSFVTQAPVLEIAPIELEKDAELQIDEKIVELAKSPEPISYLRLAITINLLLLVFACIIVFLIINKRKHPNSHFLLKLTQKLRSISFKKTKNEELTVETLKV